MAGAYRGAGLTLNIDLQGVTGSATSVIAE